MNAKMQNTQLEWHDPIVQELHSVREKLVEKYQGNLRTYSQAARVHALALGFQFSKIKTQPTATVRAVR
jgi:hypothetical protein